MQLQKARHDLEREKRHARTPIAKSHQRPLPHPNGSISIKVLAGDVLDLDQGVQLRALVLSTRLRAGPPDRPSAPSLRSPAVTVRSDVRSEQKSVSNRYQYLTVIQSRLAGGRDPRPRLRTARLKEASAAMVTAGGCIHRRLLCPIVIKFRVAKEWRDGPGTDSCAATNSGHLTRCQSCSLLSDAFASLRWRVSNPSVNQP